MIYNATTEKASIDMGTYYSSNVICQLELDKQILCNYIEIEAMFPMQFRDLAIVYTKDEINPVDGVDIVVRTIFVQKKKLNGNRYKYSYDGWHYVQLHLINGIEL